MLFAAYALLILCHQQPPSLTDLGNWTYQGSLLARHLRGLPDSYHTFKLFPVPNSATTVGIGLLCLMLPWMWACKLWLLIYLAIARWAVKSVVQSTPGSESLWLLAPATIFFNVNFWYGFLNFQFGLCLTLLLLAAILRGEQRQWWFGLLLLLTFFAHMIPFAFAATLFLLYVLQSRRYQLLWQMVPSALATAAYLIGRFVFSRNVEGGMTMVSTVQNYSLEFWAYKVNSLLKSDGFVNPGSTTGSVLWAFNAPLFCVALLADTVLSLCLVYAILPKMNVSFAGKRRESIFWWTVCLFVPVYLLLPGEAMGVSDPGSRVLQVLIAVVVALISRRDGSVFRCAVVSATLLALVDVVLFAYAAYPIRVQGTAESSSLRKVVTLGHVPNHDQDDFYEALRRNIYHLAVFPTGMMLNTPLAKIPGYPGSL